MKKQVFNILIVLVIAAVTAGALYYSQSNYGDIRLGPQQPTVSSQFHEPRLYYDFQQLIIENNLGGRVRDISKNNNHARNALVANRVEGRAGRGYQFSNSNDRLSAPDSLSLDIAGALSVSFWFKGTQATGNQMMMGKWDGTQGKISWFADISAGGGACPNQAGIDFYVSEDGGASDRVYVRECGQTYQDGNWHHFVGTFDPGRAIQMFVDGIAIGTVSGDILSVRGVYTNNLPFFVGGGYAPYQGLIDEARVYSHVLNSSEIDDLRDIQLNCNNGLDDDDDGLIDYPEDLECVSVSDESETDAGGQTCIPVRTPQDLDDVRSNLEGNYCQMNDIDLTGWNWEPIGGFYSGFVGTYDGNHKEIRNLRILQDPHTSQHLGLFGQLGSNINSEDAAYIKEVILKNVSISGGYVIGALAGGVINTVIFDTHVIGGVLQADGIAGGLIGQGGNWIINKSSVESVTITNSSIFTPLTLGGLVGAANSQNGLGEFFDHNIIMRSYAKDTFIRGGDQLGGLAGVFRGTIEESYAITNISTVTRHVGGLMGYLDNDIPSKILNTFSWGTINNEGRDPSINATGGLIGEIRIESYSSNSVVVANSYSNVSITSFFLAGGLIGKKSDDARITISNSYWDINTSGQNQSAGGEGRTTQEMTSVPRPPNTYAGWDFTEIWAQANGQYPLLQG
ncbi:MAG: LamG domain-containing protein [Nanoarchaeota archaeon]